MYLFSYLEPVCCSCPVLTVASWLAYRFLKRQVRWSGISISWRIFQFIVIHTVKGLGIVNKAEIDVFLELSCFFRDPDAAAAAKSLQSCPTLCNPRDDSPPGSPVPGILQARTLEWVAISFSNVWKWKVKVKSLSYVRLLATPWTAAYQAPPSMGFSRQECWNGLPLPSPQSSSRCWQFDL